MENGGTLQYRIEQLEKELRDFRPLERDVDRHAVRIENLTEAMEEMREAMRSLRTAVVGAALTVAVSAVGFAITALSVIR